MKNEKHNITTINNFTSKFSISFFIFKIYELQQTRVIS